MTEEGENLSTYLTNAGTLILQGVRLTAGFLQGHTAPTKMIRIKKNSSVLNGNELTFKWVPSTVSNKKKHLADICKNAVLPEKSKLLEKICKFEKIKNLFSRM